MDKADTNSETLRIAEAVREACISAALKAYEDAGVSGLCEEGRLECAISAMRLVDIDRIVRGSAAASQA